MPGETERGSVFRLPVHFPLPKRNGHQNLAVRRARVLAGDEAIVKRTVQVVAYGRRTGADIAGAPSAIAAGGRQSRDGSRAGVAKSKLKSPTTKSLRSAFLSGILQLCRKRKRGDTAGKPSTGRRSRSCESSSGNIPTAAVGNCRGSCART